MKQRDLLIELENRAENLCRQYENGQGKGCYCKIEREQGRAAIREHDDWWKKGIFRYNYPPRMIWYKANDGSPPEAAYSSKWHDDGSDEVPCSDGRGCFPLSSSEMNPHKEEEAGNTPYVRCRIEDRCLLDII